MVAGVSVGFGLVKDEVTPTLDKQNQKLKLGKRLISEATIGYKTYERDAIRALKKTASETERVAKVQRLLNKLVTDGHISQARANQTLRVAQDQISGQNKRITPLLESARSYLATWVSIAGAISLANTLITKQNELERGAVERTTEIAGSLNDLITNTKGFTEGQRVDFVEGIRQVTREVRDVPPQVIFEAAAKAISATSETEEGTEGRIEDTLKAVRRAALISPGRPENIQAITEAALGIEKVARGVIPEDEAFELLFRTLSQSRLTSTEQIRQFIPALQAIRTEAEKQGEFEREDIVAGLAFLAQQSSGGEDPTGEITKTTGSLLPRTLSDVVPAVLAKGFADQLELVRNDPRLQQKVEAELKGRGPAKGVTEQITRNIGTSGPGFQSVLEAIQRPAGGTPDEILARTLTPELRNQRLVNLAESFKTRQQLSGFADAGTALTVADRLLESLPAGEAVGQGTLFFVQRQLTDNQTATLSLLDRLIQTRSERDAEGRIFEQPVVDELREIRVLLSAQREVDQTQAQPPEPGG